MAAKLRIQKIDKLDVQADNSTVLDVTFELVNTENDEVIETLRHNFPLNTTEEQMTAELQKVVDTYNNDQELKVKNAELEAAHKVADETIGQMTGKEIGASEKQAEPVEPANSEGQAEPEGEHKEEA